jgi:4-hydroxy-tetrahydrodipicolinate reductase
VKLALHGVSGRMGKSLVRLAAEDPKIQIVGGITASDDPLLGRDLGELAGVGTLGVVSTADVGAGLLGAEVVIDFSTASAVPTLCAVAARQRVSVVSGTTGLDESGERALSKAAEAVPVLWAANMSLGVQVLAEVLEHAVRRLGKAFDVEIVEVHHRKKIDSPSGTAKRLAEAARAARPELAALHGRSGHVGARTDGEMAVLAVRGGDVVGDHTAFLLGAGERLELTHRATNRDLFAHGALFAASFLAGKKPGRYAIRDALDAL